MMVIERFCKIYADICQISPSDLDTIYASNVEFVDPITTHHGIEAVKGYFANLLSQAESCQFDIATVLPCDDPSGGLSHIANWTMTLKLNKTNKIITLDGTTQLNVKDDMIVYHKDYYDLGEMVYEHIPILSFFVKAVKKRLAQ